MDDVVEKSDNDVPLSSPMLVGLATTPCGTTMGFYGMSDNIFSNEGNRVTKQT